MRVKSMFGLSERSFVVSAPLDVRVYPKLLTPKLTAARARAFGWAGSTPSKYRGGRLEFVNIRQYAVGDRAKDVNWRASARRGSVLVNEWQVERGLDSVVVVDLFSDDLPKVGAWSGRGEVIEAAYETASSLIAPGNRVGMLIMGSLLDKVTPGFGKRNLRAMLEGLIDSEEGNVWNIQYTEEFLENFFREQYTKRGGTLFFLSAGVNVRLLAVVGLLSKKGFVCYSIVVDTLKSQTQALVESRQASKQEADVALRFARAELDWFESELSRCSSVFEWSRETGALPTGSRSK